MPKGYRNQYNPDYVSPPGETLQEILETLGMTQSELSERTGRPKKTINEIVKGKAALTPDTALQLERVLGIPSSFWNNREYHYREYLARANEKRRLEGRLSWLEELPVRDMIKLGWIKGHADKIQQIRELLNFFGVSSPDSWAELWCGPKVSFRKSKIFRNDPGLLSAWLRMGEIRGRGIRCAPFDARRFEASLGEVRKLTLADPKGVQGRLERLCSHSGVALVFLPEPPRISISGATRWMGGQKALMQISLRYTTDDQFWFTFFHEAGHILLHGKRGFFIDNSGDRDDLEEEANAFALDALAPAARLDPFLSAGNLGKDALKACAGRLGIAPGVLVGVLQQKGVLAHSQHNDLKRLFKLGTP